MSPKSRSVHIRTVMDLPPLIMMGKKKKQGVGFEDKVGSF
jgi:hypothetical protein